MRKKISLTAELLRSLLDYDAEAGVFRWRISRGSRRAGAVAGNLRRDGYVGILVCGRLYTAHRLAWLWVTGEWPIEVDHRDGDGSNNAWTNLRLATHAQNMSNTKKPRHNTSGFKGVHLRRQGDFSASIQHKGKTIHLGLFPTAEAAHAAYCAAAERIHGEFARAA